MGSTFGKVRKYNLTPVDDSAIPLKFNPVTEDQTQTTIDPSLSSGLKNTATLRPPSKPPIKDNVEPFHETTPNYGQYFGDHIRFNVDGMYIPRTKSKVGHLFSSDSDQDSNLRGRKNGDSHNLPRQKFYSAEDIDKLLMQIKSKPRTKSFIKPNEPPMEPVQRPTQSCKYCQGFNRWDYQGQYVLESSPSPHGPASTVEYPTNLKQRLPFDHTPPVKHYHIIEVNPQPYFTSKYNPHLQGGYNVLDDTSRPNVMQYNTNHQDTQTYHTQPVAPHQNVASRENHSFHPHQNVQQKNPQNTNKSTTHATQNKSSGFEQRFTPNELRTQSLHRDAPRQCYTIPEENITWPPPFHHSSSFHQVNRSGFHK